MNILVTGATGNISSLTIPQLLAAGANVRAVVHDAGKAGPLKKQGCEVVVLDLNEPVPTSLFDGIDRALFLTAPNPQANVQMSNLIQAAKGTNVHVVRLSAIKAAADAPTENGRLHFQSDEELIESGLTYTILRPQFFFQNALWSMESIQKEGKIYQGMGEAKIGMIDVRDVADCVATILLKGGHENKIYDPTGPASITWHDLANAVGKELHTDVEYVPVGDEQVRAASLPMGEWFAQLMVDYSKAYADGWGDFTTKDVQTITGHPPRDVNAFANEVIAPMAQTV